MKIGIVGLGAIGRRHYENAFKLGHEVRGYDPVSPSAHFGRETQLYDWCDACVVATPSPYHESGIRACIERGKHVLVEKPISTSVGMLPQLLSAADAKGVTVMMGNNLRFHPCVKQAKLFLTEGVIGSPRWAVFICATEGSLASMRDGAILNTGSHEVDVALHLFGPAHVACASARWVSPDDGEERRPINADETADFVLVHDTGVRSTFHLDLITPARVREFWIDGKVYIDLDQRGVRHYLDHDKNPDWSIFENTSYDDDYVTELRSFVDRIEGHLVPGATGYDGLETLRILLEVRKRAGLP